MSLSPEDCARLDTERHQRDRVPRRGYDYDDRRRIVIAVRICVEFVLYADDGLGASCVRTRPRQYSRAAPLLWCPMLRGRLPPDEGEHQETIESA